MSDPFRLRVLKVLSAALGEITKANGYSHDFTGKVFRGRLYYGSNDPLPMLTILEPPLPPDRVPAPINSSVTKGPWEIIIQGFVPDDRDNPTDPAHFAMADVKKRLAIEAKRKGVPPMNMPDPFGMGHGDRKSYIENVKIGPGVVRPPEDGVSAKAYFWLTLTLNIVEDNFDPFS